MALASRADAERLETGAPVLQAAHGVQLDRRIEQAAPAPENRIHAANDQARRLGRVAGERGTDRIHAGNHQARRIRHADRHFLAERIHAADPKMGERRGIHAGQKLVLHLRAVDDFRIP